MTTFHEMLNTVSFRNMAGKVDGHDDLWALRDLMFERLCSLQHNAANVYNELRDYGNGEIATTIAMDYAFTIERLERDIMTIEQYCKKRGIMRPRD